MSMIMITNGNNVHEPEYHAEVTATKILAIAETASEDKQVAMRGIRRKIENVLLAHHVFVHDDEQAKIADGGLDHCDCDIDCAHHADGCDRIYDEIVEASRGTPLEVHFIKPEVREAIIAELHHETRSQMNVHRIVHKQAVS